MPTLGYLGAALAACALGLRVTRAAPLPARIAVPALLVAVVFVPLSEARVGGYLIALVGEPSGTSLVLLVAASLALMRWSGAPSDGELSWVSGAVAMGALALYPFALGFSALDTYALGYEPRGLLVAVAVLCVAAGVAGRWLLVLCLASAMALHRLGVGESSNFWDYLLDPWVSLYAAMRLLRFTIFARSSKLR